MADDQVKYSDLIVPDDSFEKLQKELEAVKQKISDLKTEASGLASALKNVSTATKDQQQATAANAATVEALARKTKELNDEKSRLEAATKRYNNLTDEEARHLKKLNDWLSLGAQWQEAAAKHIDTTNMSYNEMKATMNALVATLRTFDTEQKKNSTTAMVLETAVEQLRDAMKDLDNNTKAAANAEKQMAEEAKKAAQEEEEAYKESQKEAAKRVKTQEELHNARQKEIEDAFKARDAEMAKMKLTEEEYNSVKQLKSALAGTAQEQISAMQNLEIQNKSYNELYQTYNAIKDVLNAMTVAERENTEAGKAMVNRSKEIRDTLNNLQQQTGNYTLNVGNYMSAMNGLQFQAQQLMREIPSAVNIQQFFLAISNNLPMFADALSRWNKELPGIKSKIEAINGEIDLQKGKLSTLVEGSDAYIAKQEDIKRLQAQQNDLQKLNVSGWRAILKAVGSWQTLLIGGLLLLRNWKSVTEAIRNLFVRMTDEQKMFKAVNDEAASSVGSMTAKFQALQKEWKELKAENQGDWLKQHKDDWNELGYSIDNAKKAEDFYVNNTAAVQKAIDDRARSIAAMKLATEKYEEAFKKQVEAEQGKASRQSSFGSHLARGLAGAGMAEGTGVLTKEQMDSQTRAEEQAIEELYNKRMKKVEELKEEAKKLITTFALPEQGKTPKGPKEKEPKDQVADLLTLTRQLEDQIIANIENEYKRLDEEETKRHERFIQNQEADLAKLAENDPRRAVINQRIEEEERTHERKMEEIDQKRYDELSKLTQKRLEDEKKAEEAARKAAEEAFKQEEKEFKTKQEIAKRQFELTKHTAIEEKKFVMQQQLEFLKWRIDHAEALGISKDMLAVMKQEYEEMFRQFQAGNYSTGQKNIRGSASDIIDLLFPDWDADKKRALNSVFDQAKEALNSWMDARKAAADQAKELADDEVSAAENALDREIELRNQGYANDVALREKELADAKAAQKKAAEEQKKIAGEQILLDAALQTSSMITASANIIKQFPNPLAWGPMLAVMWGAFGYAKLKAYQESQKSIKFKEGGVMLLEGGSHESGHDVNLGIGPDGSNLRAEGGEYFAVINKRSSRKYGSQIPAVVNALNSGMFEDRYIKTSDAVGLLPQVIRADNGTAVDLSSLEGGVDALVKQGEQNWTIEGDYRVLRYKNLTRRVKIS